MVRTAETSVARTPRGIEVHGAAGLNGVAVADGCVVAAGCVVATDGVVGGGMTTFTLSFPASGRFVPLRPPRSAFYSDGRRRGLSRGRWKRGSLAVPGGPPFDAARNDDSPDAIAPVVASVDGEGTETPARLRMRAKSPGARTDAAEHDDSERGPETRRLAPRLPRLTRSGRSSWSGAPRGANGVDASSVGQRPAGAARVALADLGRRAAGSGSAPRATPSS